MMSLQQVSAILGGELLGKDASFDRVSIDSRSLQSGDLYIALHGQRFDGHDYLKQAEQAGAVAAVVHKLVTTKLPLLKVEDTRKALADLAAAKRKLFAGTLIGITGSNGKTTVKEMTSAILQLQGEVLATQGNFNNDIGLPLTLLRLREEDFAVIEMGANHPGEIATLAHIAQPDIALINNAGASHLEGFGDLEGVAQAKGELFKGLSPQGIAIINEDDDFSGYWASLCTDKKVMRYSMLRPDVDIFGQWKSTELGGQLSVSAGNDSFTINLNCFGLHNAMNALAAITIAKTLNVSNEIITQALQKFTPVKGRLNVHKLSNELSVIDDTYNANPTSILAGIKVLTELPGNHWLVLGDMGELGKDARRLHFDVGMQARTLGVSRLLAIGEASQHAVDAFGENAYFFDSNEALISYIKQQLSGCTGILVKGSRFMQMEKVVELLIEGFN